jgi:hypothetical protein
MTQLWSASVFLTAHALIFAGALVSPKTHVLTAEKNDTEVLVRTGDEVVLKLPAQQPYWWGKLGDLPGLEAMGEPKFEEMEGANPKQLGRAKWFILRYRVKSDPSAIPAEWMYCQFGKTTENGKEIERGELLTPDTIPKKKGTIFRVKLKLER